MQHVMDFSSNNQAHRQGGVEEVCSNPPFGLQKILYALLDCIYILSSLLFEIGPVASMLLRITAVQTIYGSWKIGGTHV